MAVQDLTPQLRTRLGRVERAVGIFVTLATLLLIAGFGYYIYNTAQRKGWFVLKLPYHTFVESGAGLNVGDPVKLLGFTAGEITKIKPLPPDSDYGNVYIQFEITDPYEGYIWDDSKVKVGSGDFLGKRFLEVGKGGSSKRTNLHSSYRVEKAVVTGIWDDKKGAFLPFEKGSQGYTLYADESPALAARFEELADQIQKALPNVMHLTNQLAALIQNTVRISSNADRLLTAAEPIVTNLAAITENIRNPNGSLGNWLIPTNLNSQLSQTLTNLDSTLNSAKVTLTNANASLTTLATNLDATLENLSNMTSNLNVQVQQNTNILSGVSGLVTHSDEMMQGLKHHWLLRSAFKNKPNAPPSNPQYPPLGGKR